MEFLDGPTLAERLRKGALPLNELLKVGIEVAEALEVAHRSGIMHRNLKPGNINADQVRRQADGLRLGETDIPKT
jgi:eukaryotic-like serine/threonine-protein kinase